MTRISVETAQAVAEDLLKFTVKSGRYSSEFSLSGAQRDDLGSHGVVRVMRDEIGHAVWLTDKLNGHGVVAAVAGKARRFGR